MPAAGRRITYQVWALAAAISTAGYGDLLRQPQNEVRQRVAAKPGIDVPESEDQPGGRSPLVCFAPGLSEEYQFSAEPFRCRSLGSALRLDARTVATIDPLGSVPRPNG